MYMFPGTLCAIKSLFLNFKRPKIVFSEIVHKRTHQLKPGHTVNTGNAFEETENKKKGMHVLIAEP